MEMGRRSSRVVRTSALLLGDKIGNNVGGWPPFGFFLPIFEPWVRCCLYHSVSCRAACIVATAPITCTLSLARANGAGAVIVFICWTKPGRCE